MLLCAPAKRVMTKLERNFTQLSLLDKEDHGEDQMELIFIAKTTLVLL
jgi:hypothetical protein